MLKIASKRKIMATTAEPLLLLPVLALMDDEIVAPIHTIEHPMFANKSKGRRPTLSTREAPNKAKANCITFRPRLRLSCVKESVIPAVSRTAEMKYEIGP